MILENFHDNIVCNYHDNFSFQFIKLYSVVVRLFFGLYVYYAYSYFQLYKFFEVDELLIIKKYLFIDITLCRKIALYLFEI